MASKRYPKWVVKHGMCGTRIYNIWRDMRHRCMCPSLRNYKHYGGRGISVCDEWQDFMAFYKWAMENGYSDSLTIDRIDVNGNYTPENCRWVDASTQRANKRPMSNSGYIGVELHSNGSCYMTQLRYHGKRLLVYSSKSKNECAKVRNDFIIEHGLPHPLNVIDPANEDVREPKSKPIQRYRATEKETGKVIEADGMERLGQAVGLTQQFIGQCISGKRVSSRYIFEKVTK